MVRKSEDGQRDIHVEVVSHPHSSKWSRQQLMFAALPVAVDTSCTFSAEAKMMALRHLCDNRAQGSGFIQMAEDQARNLPEQALLRLVLSCAGLVVMHV